MVSAKSFCANNRYYSISLQVNKQIKLLLEFFVLDYTLIGHSFISIDFYPKSNNKFNLTTREYFKNS